MTDRGDAKLNLALWPGWVRRVAVYSLLGMPLLLSWALRLGDDSPSRAYLAVLLAGAAPAVFIVALYGPPEYANRSSTDWQGAWLRAGVSVAVLLGVTAFVVFYPYSLVTWPFPT